MAGLVPAFHVLDPSKTRMPSPRQAYGECNGNTIARHGSAPFHELPSNEARNLAHHCMRALCIAAKYSRLCRFRVNNRGYRAAALLSASPQSADTTQTLGR
jgi:hypothetical protein